MEVLPYDDLDELLSRTLDAFSINSKDFDATGTELYLSNTSKIEKIEDLTGEDDLTLGMSVKFGYPGTRSHQLLNILIDSSMCSARYLLHSAIASRDAEAVKYTMTKYYIETCQEYTYSKESGYQTLYTDDDDDDEISSIKDLIFRSDSYYILDLFKGYFHDPWNDDYAVEASRLGAENTREWFSCAKHYMRSHCREKYPRLKYAL